MIAALFVEKNGIYADLPDVDLWDKERNAKKYNGPYPVVAHPPCSRWCRLAGVIESRWGHKRGEDGGMFASALESVRRFGGVLEHPAYSDAFKHYQLPIPQTRGGWQRSICGGWVCHVEQGQYGHAARKATWLYAIGGYLPSLRWGSAQGAALVSYCQNKTRKDDSRPRLSSKQASATPIAFRNVLLDIARRSAYEMART